MKNSWQNILGVLATVITSIAAALLAFPSVVERTLNLALDKISLVSFDREFRRQSIIDLIIAFDQKHDTFSCVVEVQPDFGVEAIWLNPDADFFWKEKELSIGEVEYPKLSNIDTLRSRQCICQEFKGDAVCACNLLGKTHLLISFPQKEINIPEFEIDLGLLAGRIDRFFVHKSP
jgi:hypothetical protein